MYCRLVFVKKGQPVLAENFYTVKFVSGLRLLLRLLLSLLTLRKWSLLSRLPRHNLLQLLVPRNHRSRSPLHLTLSGGGVLFVDGDYKMQRRTLIRSLDKVL